MIYTCNKQTTAIVGINNNPKRGLECVFMKKSKFDGGAGNASARNFEKVAWEYLWFWLRYAIIFAWKKGASLVFHKEIIEYERKV